MIDTQGHFLEKPRRTKMIARYCPAEFASLWSAEQRYEIWLSVELVACEAMEDEGWVPAGTAARIREKSPVLDPLRIEEIERTVKHDVIAFLTHVEELVGPDARFLHRGMTSSDVLDTSFALLLKRACELLIPRLEGLIEALGKRADEHRHTPMMGRSHGMHAEPVTFGLVMAGHLSEMKRGRSRLRAAMHEIAVGKISGAVGTYAHLHPRMEEKALKALGLRPETVSTQVVPRDRHAVLFSALSILAAGIERLATNVRHFQRSELGEAQESFSKGQKGSSAMPHKRNPIASENLCGLSRVVRASVIAALENVPLWHERDISHSSVERYIAPDATTTLGYMLERATALVEGLLVFPEGMLRNIELSKELYCSEAVLLAMVEHGTARQKAYEMVQRSAMRTHAGEGRFRDLLAADAEVMAVLSSDVLNRCFERDHMLRHVGTIIDRAIAED